jgi:hypothetical protein
MTYKHQIFKALKHLILILLRLAFISMTFGEGRKSPEGNKKLIIF